MRRLVLILAFLAATVFHVSLNHVQNPLSGQTANADNATEARGIDPAGAELGYAPGRAFSFIQTSYWVPEGIDSSAVPVADSSLSAMPDSSVSDFLAPSMPFKLSGKDAIMERTAAGRFAGIRSYVHTIVVHPDSSEPQDLGVVADTLDFHDGSLALELGCWLSRVPVSADGSSEDTCAYPHLPDSARYRRVRTATRKRVQIESGVEWWELEATTRLSVITWRRLKNGTRQRVEFAGDLSERFLYEPGRAQVDSVRAAGTLPGRVISMDSSGRYDTVAVRWVISRSGAWGPDPQEEDRRRFDYFAEHGRDSASVADTANPYLWLVAAGLRGDTTAIDSLFVLRSRLRNPIARRALDNWIRQVHGHPGSSELFRFVRKPRGRSYFRRRAAEGYRPGDDFLLHAMLEWGFVRDTLSSTVARVLADKLVAIPRGEALLVDRARLLRELRDILQYSPGFEREAGPVFAEASRRANEPYARQLLLIAAYQTDPKMYHHSWRSWQIRRRRDRSHCRTRRAAHRSVWPRTARTTFHSPVCPRLGISTIAIGKELRTGGLSGRKCFAIGSRRVI